MLIRLQEAIIRVSDQLGIAVITVPREGPFRDSLNVVSIWLERARTVSTPQYRATTQNQNSLAVPNTMTAEQPPLFAPTTATREPIAVAVNYDNFSPFTLPPCGWELEGRPAVTPTAVNTLRDLIGHLRSFARAYHADVADLPDDVTAKHYQIQIELSVDRFRRGIEANSWFDRLRTLLRRQFKAELSAASVNLLIDNISKDCGLTISQAEGLAIEDVLRRLSPDPQTEPVRPTWNAETRTLFINQWRGTVRSNGTVLVKILNAFEAVKWPQTAVPMGEISTPSDRKKCIERFLEDSPIDINPDGTGGGMIWRWKSGS